MEGTIIYWNPWWEKGYKEIPILYRDSFDDLERLKNRKEIIFVEGVRRSGKTSLFYYLVHLILDKTTPGNILYLNLDDDNLRNQKLEDIYQAYKKLFPESKGKRYVFRA